MTEINIFWHRRDLRYQDNVGLYHALSAGLPVLPVFDFDTNILDDLEEKQDPRVAFILQSVQDLHRTYRKNGSSLAVFHSTPEAAFSALIRKYTVKAVYTNRDYEPYAKQRDLEIQMLLAREDIEFHTFKDQVIFEEGEIMNGSGKPYKVFTSYKKAWLKKLSRNDTDSYKSELGFGSLCKTDIRVAVSLASLGFEPSKIIPPKSLFEESVIRNYATKRDHPAIEGTTRLGVHLRFGTVSVRRAVAQGLNASDVWLSELIWREFFMMILAHHPEVVDRSFRAKYDLIQWSNNEEYFQRWCEGTTGYPIVDAGMRELNATGFMHNRVRMITASFLTKHLLIDWRWGERYFAQKLLDYELSSNNGNWQWAAGTGTDAQPYFRIFNPV